MNMKRNRSVPNLKNFKYSPSFQQGDASKGTVFRNIFGLKTQDANNTSITSDDKPQKGDDSSSKRNSRFSRNLNKLLSDSVGVLHKDNNKSLNLFKKISLRLSGSKKDKHKSKHKNNFDVVREIKTSSHPNLKNDQLYLNDKEHALSDNFEEPETSCHSSRFVRQRIAQMSMRKAFGIFEDYEPTSEVALDKKETSNNDYEDEGYIMQLHKLFKKGDKIQHNKNIPIKTIDQFCDSNSRPHPPNEIAQDSPPDKNAASFNFIQFEELHEFCAHSCNQKSSFYVHNNSPILDHNSTLKPDLYATQLREQVTKLSLSKCSSMMFNKKPNNKVCASRFISLDSGESQYKEGPDLIYTNGKDFQKQISQIGDPETIQDLLQNNLNFHQQIVLHTHSNSQLTNAFVEKENIQKFDDHHSPSYNFESEQHLMANDYMHDKSGLSCSKNVNSDLQNHAECENSEMGNDLRFGNQDSNHINQSRENSYKSEIKEVLADQYATDQMSGHKTLLSNQKYAPVKFVPNSDSFQTQTQDVNRSVDITKETDMVLKSRRSRPVASEATKTTPKNNIVDSSLLELHNISDQFESNALPSYDATENNQNQFCETGKDKKPRVTSKSSRDNEPSNKSYKHMIRRMSVEKRGKSLEETQCEEFALTLAEKLKAVDPHLSNILSVKHKSILDHVPTLTNVCYCPDYLEGSSQISELRANSQENACLKPKFNGKSRNYSIEQEKNEMENMLVKKIDALYQEKISVERKIVKNNEFGKEVCSSLTNHLKSRQVEKFLALAQETEKVMKLILKLSNMLARTEESYLNLPHNSTDKEKATLHNKTESLKSRLHEAKLIKENVDAKYEQILSAFHSQLPSSVTKNFDVFMGIKNLHMLDLEELGNEICLAQRQLHSLRSTMIKNSVGTSC